MTKPRVLPDVTIHEFLGNPYGEPENPWMLVWVALLVLAIAAGAWFIPLWVISQ